jgi:hypothetical protein
MIYRQNTNYSKANKAYGFFTESRLEALLAVVPNKIRFTGISILLPLIV